MDSQSLIESGRGAVPQMCCWGLDRGYSVMSLGGQHMMLKRRPDLGSSDVLDIEMRRPCVLCFGRLGRQISYH